MHSAGQPDPRSRPSALGEKIRQNILSQGFISIIFAVILPWFQQHCERKFRDARAIPAASRSMWNRFWVSLYPFAHAGTCVTSSVYKLLYLFEQTDVWSPALHAGNFCLVRSPPPPPPQSGMETKQGLWWRVADALQAAGGKSLWMAIYGMQFAQWWFRREHLLQPYRPQKVPPPPPPRSCLVQNAAAGKSHIFLPENRTVCPLCHRIRTNPALSSAGYVFCYPCLAKYVRESRQCPISGLPMAQEQIRRLIEDTD